MTNNPTPEQMALAEKITTNAIPDDTTEEASTLAAACCRAVAQMGEG